MNKSCVAACLKSVRMAVESVSGCSWSECPDQRGITVRMCVEWVSESAWNPQAESIAAGMHGRNHVKASFEHYDGTPMSPEEALAHQCVHAASIGKSLGQEFLLKAPAPLLEQFSAVAGNRNVADSGAMLAGLLHGFMIAFATRETEERALKAMLEVARICDEANNIRGTSFGQASE